jgi:hypothetical protein
MESSLKELPKALAAFQAEHHAAGRDSKGNYGTYTSLAGALAAVQPATAHGLCNSVTFLPLGDNVMVVRTTLYHSSGESVYSDLPVSYGLSEGRGNHMQNLGSAITYARRYTLLALYGLAGDDDDAETATAPAPRAQPRPAATKPMPVAPLPPQAEEVPAAATAQPAQIVWIEPARQKRIVAAIKTHDDKDAILAAFKAEFSIATPKVTPDQIQLPAHGDFLEARLGLADAA